MGACVYEGGGNVRSRCCWVYTISGGLLISSTVGIQTDRQTHPEDEWSGAARSHPSVRVVPPSLKRLTPALTPVDPRAGR